MSALKNRRGMPLTGADGQVDQVRPDGDGRHVWRETYGWQLGQITAVITSSTPRLYKKFNYRMVWADGTKGPAKLGVENYAYGTNAQLNSWVVLNEA